jgi:hypothetical protein
MIQIQIILDFRPGKNTIDLNILEREDANDMERELARYIQELHVGIIGMAQEEMPGEIDVTLIGCPAGGAHEWGTDGQHSNEYCKKCFVCREAQMKDSGITARLKRIDRLQQQVAALIYEIERSGHPKAGEIVQAIKNEGWVVVSAELAGAEILGQDNDPPRTRPRKA